MSENYDKLAEALESHLPIDGCKHSEALPLARQLIEERERLMNAWKAMREENERLKRAYMGPYLQDLQSRLSAMERAAEETAANYHEVVAEKQKLVDERDEAIRGAAQQVEVVRSYQTRLSAAEQREQDREVEVNALLAVNNAKTEKLKRAEEVVEAAKRSCEAGTASWEVEQSIRRYEEGK